MRRTCVVFLLTITTLGIAPVASASPAVTKLAVSANGANESPNHGDNKGTASGTFVLNTAKNTICFLNMKEKGLSRITGAHIHLGASGIDGSIFANFDISKFNKNESICLNVDPLVLLDIVKYPSDYYFNVHTKKFPSGAVRGQLKNRS